MTIFFEYPDDITGKVLDTYLQSGWFRMRQAIFTCRYLIKEGELNTAVWLRLPVHKRRFSKSLRKIMNRNNRMFEVTCSPLQITPEKEELYVRYQEVVRERLAACLFEDLYDSDRDVYQSWAFEIRHNGKLVAFSVFDIGERSMESVTGVYDPDFAKHSLGIYTMLLEVERSVQMGLEYYYIGYFGTNTRVFDYKLRLGKGLEFLDPLSQQWLPMEVYQQDNMPCAKLLSAYRVINQRLLSKGIPSQLNLHPAYRFALLNKGLLFPRLKSPLFVIVCPNNKTTYKLVIDYELESQEYRLLLGKHLRLLNVDPSLLVQSAEGPRVCKGLMAIEQEFVRASDPDEVVALLEVES